VTAWSLAILFFHLFLSPSDVRWQAAFGNSLCNLTRIWNIDEIRFDSFYFETVVSTSSDRVTRVLAWNCRQTVVVLFHD
jgi:hypothetical protein